MTSRRDVPTILLSIETLSRELDSKIVTAAALASAGCRVIVGHKEIAQALARKSRGVVWLGKSLGARDEAGTTVADALAANGSPVMLLVDEGGIHQANVWTEFVLRKHDVDFFRSRSVSRVCAWGRRQRDTIASYAPELKDAITVTGSPRFDLCTPEYDWIETLVKDGTREKCAPYILVATRFESLTHTGGLHEPFVREMNRSVWPKNMDAAAVANLWFAKWRRDVHDFAEMVVFVKELATHHPKYTIVLRPHPSENIAFYEHAFASFPNVVVTRAHSVLYWIRCASLFVHTNSTSGVEAMLAGRPVLLFRAGMSSRDDVDEEVAREAGLTVRTVGEALDAAERLLRGEAPTHAWSPHATSILNNLIAPSIPMVVQETLAVMGEHRITSSDVHIPERAGTLRRMIGRVRRQRRAVDPYVASKRGRIDAGHVEQLLDGCRRHGFRGASLREVTSEQVVIEPA